MWNGTHQNSLGRGMRGVNIHHSSTQTHFILFVLQLSHQRANDSLYRNSLLYYPQNKYLTNQKPDDIIYVHFIPWNPSPTHSYYIPTRHYGYEPTKTTTYNKLLQLKLAQQSTTPWELIFRLIDCIQKTKSDYVQSYLARQTNLSSD